MPAIAVQSPRLPRPNVTPENTNETSVMSTPTRWAGRVPLLKTGAYADGLPFHDIHYLCCKLILRPHHFRSRKSLFDFAKMLRQPAEQNEVDFSGKHFKNRPSQIREVLFVD